MRRRVILLSASARRPGIGPTAGLRQERISRGRSTFFTAPHIFLDGLLAQPSSGRHFEFLERQTHDTAARRIRLRPPLQRQDLRATPFRRSGPARRQRRHCRRRRCPSRRISCRFHHLPRHRGRRPPLPGTETIPLCFRRHSPARALLPRRVLFRHSRPRRAGQEHHYRLRHSAIGVSTPTSPMDCQRCLPALSGLFRRSRLACPGERRRLRRDLAILSISPRRPAFTAACASTYRRKPMSRARNPGLPRPQHVRSPPTPSGP